MPSPSPSSVDMGQPVPQNGGSEDDVDFLEKGQITGEKNDETAAPFTPRTRDETITACLQVLGAFFLMFNSWYVGFSLYASELY